MNCDLCKFSSDGECTKKPKPQPNADGRCSYFIKSGIEKCTHHWIIGIPINGASTGVCKLCEEERVFNSSSTSWKKYDWRKRPFKLGKKDE